MAAAATTSVLLLVLAGLAQSGKVQRNVTSPNWLDLSWIESQISSFE